MRRHLSNGLALVRANAVILTNSGLLALGSALAAVLGFAYWWLAARMFPPGTVGAQSALISAMAFIGLFGEAGFGTMLIGEAIGHAERAHALIAAASLAGTGAALLLAAPGAYYLAVQGMMTGTDAALFAAGCGMTGFGLVIDQAFIGLLLSRLQFYRSLLFSVLKLVLLIAVARLTQNQTAILLSWVGALATSLAISCGHSWYTRALRITLPDFRMLGKQIPLVIDHHLLNLAATAPQLILPLVVSFVLGPAVNAAFYAGWMILSIGLMMPASLTTVLFSIGAAAPSSLPDKLRLSFNISLGFGVATTFVLAAFPNLILGLFNPAYPQLAGPALQLFGIGLLGGVVKQHYILLVRMQRCMMRGAMWLALGGALEITLAALSGRSGSVQLLTVGWLLGLTVEALFLARPLLRYGRPAPLGGSVAQTPA